MANATEESLLLVWSLVLLVSCVILNLAAILLLLRTAGNCHRDGSVPALLSLLASNLLHALLVQVFGVHQQVTGSFLFTEKLCTLIQINDGVLSAVPFPTACLQLMVCVRSLRRTRQPYTYCHLCCGALMVIALPWIAAFLTFTMPQAQGILQGRCEFGSRPPLSQFVLQQSAALALPVLLLILVVLFSLPSIFSCPSPCTWLPRPLLRNQKRDLLLLATMVAVHILFQGPMVGVQALIWYRDLHAEVLGLTVRVLEDLPLLLNPLAILTLRPGRERPEPKRESLLQSLEGLADLEEGFSEENLQMIVSMDGKDLETALAASKTTIL